MGPITRLRVVTGAGFVRRATGCVAALSLTMCAACTTAPPPDVENICAIFEERNGWYKAARKSEKRWGTPVHVQMSIIRQESSFRANARPPREKLLGFVPWKRPSNAYGYAQALDSTWDRYRKDTGRRFADRDDFRDAIDFVGWYTHMSNKTVGISKWDPYNQYLAYHEGQSGWRKGTYKSKGWLIDTARRVDHRAREWGAQLKRCEGDLDKGWWIFGDLAPAEMPETGQRAINGGLTVVGARST